MVGVILGWGYDLAVNYSSVLGQLEVDLVAVDIYGLDGQLVALLQLERCARGDGHLGVVVHQDLEELLVGQQFSSVDSCTELVSIQAQSASLHVAGEVLLGQEAYDVVVSPVSEVEVVLLGGWWCKRRRWAPEACCPLLWLCRSFSVPRLSSIS